MAIKIIVTLEGGLVQSVYAPNGQEVEYEVLDWDGMDEVLTEAGLDGDKEYPDGEDIKWADDLVADKMLDSIDSDKLLTMDEAAELVAAELGVAKTS